MSGFTFVIPGRIGAWKRAGRAGKITFTPPKMRSDQAQVKWFAVQAMKAAGCGMLVGPLKMRITVQRAYPVSWSAKKRAATNWITSTPDWDNYAKQIGDALNGIAYHDDAQIAWGELEKCYSSRGEESTTVTIDELEPRL